MTTSPHSSLKHRVVTRDTSLVRQILAFMIAAVCIFSTVSGYAAPKKKEKKSPKASLSTSRLYSKSRPPVAPRKVAPAEEPEDDSVILEPISIKGAQTLPVTALEKVAIIRTGPQQVRLEKAPKFKTRFAGRVAGITEKHDFVFFTVDQELQAFTDKLVKQVRAPHVAVVAMEPRTGRILAMSEKSSLSKELYSHTGLPAASIFKIVTSAAALETNEVDPYRPVPFRGGTYSLTRWNYLPNSKTDKRQMTLAEALGKSCNVVFARVALKHLNPRLLREYALLFGFNRDLEADLPLSQSSAFIPENDDYELGRTAAGFGEVTLSPVHAAALVSGIANNGLLPKPILIDKIVSGDGTITYKSQPEAITRIVAPKTATVLLDMMEYTTTMGTSRGAFMHKKRKLLPFDVAAKTGTLSGTNPEGVNHWFVATAPIKNPRIALSVIVVNAPGSGVKASRLGKSVIEQYLRNNRN
jgi:peptidoglycan glycosyltransferase